jgi:deoxyribose-phosphate aldolase
MSKLADIAKILDHNLLRPDATEADIIKLCEESAANEFHSVCIHPAFIDTAREALFGTHVKVGTVIGFPLGMTLPRVKTYEAIEAQLSGADELDIVLNIGLIKSGDWDAVEKEIDEIIVATPGAVHKVIIEACYLTDDEKERACLAVMRSGADFIKTSTGFGAGGAEIKDVKLIKSVTGGKIGIKAAGGIKTLNDVLAFIRAGATRIGTSSGVEIMKEAVTY